VMHAPETIRGGHVRLRLRSDSGASVEAWAFEPTKTLTRVARSLLPGDRVRVAAGRGRSRSLGIERLTLLRLVPRWGPARPPRCRACRRTADSRGAGRGYRCGVCRARFPPESAVRIRGVPEFLPGQYDPTPSARRHLHPRVPPAR
jgi:tRNA(Ile2)-agmatinylcytidine synthase